ncbi:MAG: tetratricopeptide repeat protein [Cyanobacteriota bacterium]
MNNPCVAQQQNLILRGCVERDNQTVCPSSMEEDFSDNRLLYYSYKNKKVIEQAKSFYNKAVKYEKEGKINFAEMYYKKAIELLPNFVEAHTNLGGVYICNKNYDMAIYEFSVVGRLTPDYFPIIYNNLGLAYEGKGDTQKAEEFYTLAINLDPNNAMAHNNLASLYIKMKLYDEAIYHLKIVNRLSPGFLSENIVKIVNNYSG